MKVYFPLNIKKHLTFCQMVSLSAYLLNQVAKVHSEFWDKQRVYLEL